MTKPLYVSAIASVIALASSCSVETTSAAPVVVSSGTLTLDWTINGTTDPDQCSQGAATSLDVTVDTIDGASAGEFQQACNAFATNIELPPGTYTADAVLLDSNGDDRTTAVHVDAFTIRSSEDLDVPIDFPARSFR